MLLVALATILIPVGAPASQGPLSRERPRAGVFCFSNQIGDSSEAHPVKTKSPTGALIRSGLVPGWGQFYNEQYIKSGLVFMLEGMLIGGAVVEHTRAEDDHRAWTDTTKSDQARESAWLRYSRRIDKRNTYLWYLAGVKFLSMVDAYVDAHLYRFDEGPFAVRLEAWPEEGWEVGLVVRWGLR